jgi:2-oxo-4-hydroxy-4-carboxy--5-ureidoimidazoline (OHCU) decarboxylase
VTDRTQPQLLSIHVLNALKPDDFGHALRPLFEAAAPLVKALYPERPFASYAALIDRAESLAIHTLPAAEQMRVVNAHPRIGETPARLSTLSLREQGDDRAAGLPPEDVEQLNARLDNLNQDYEARFGFRFVVFVNKRPKSEIADVLQQRLNNADAQQELRMGLNEMFRIARDRLRGLES